MGLFCPIGSQTSLRTFGIYKQAEEFNRTMHQKIKRLVQIVLFVTYTPATLVPILYLVLGTPPQEEWELPPPVRNWFLFSDSHFFHFISIPIHHFRIQLQIRIPFPVTTLHCCSNPLVESITWSFLALCYMPKLDCVNFLRYATMIYVGFAMNSATAMIMMQQPQNGRWMMHLACIRR